MCRQEKVDNPATPSELTEEFSFLLKSYNCICAFRSSIQKELQPLTHSSPVGQTLPYEKFQQNLKKYSSLIQNEV